MEEKVEKMHLDGKVFLDRKVEPFNVKIGGGKIQAWLYKIVDLKTGKVEVFEAEEMLAQNLVKRVRKKCKV